MPIYKTTVAFHKEYTITAKDAAEANDLLKEKVDEDAFCSDLHYDGIDVFEDKFVTCPECKGDGVIGEDGEDEDCLNCSGKGTVPFKA